MSLGLTLAAALVVGVVLGLLGGGGSILIVPVLLYLAGLPTSPAITTSLFVVGVTAAAAMVPHARAGRVRWRTGLLFGAAGMAGGYLGGRLAGYLPAVLLLSVFGLVMLAAAVAMIRGRSGAAARAPRHVPVLRLGGLGAAVGLFTGLVGAGGGFVIVPALALLAGVPMAAAVGTSLLVIAMQATAGLLGHLHTTPVSWPLALAVTAAAVAGSLLGARLSGRVPQRRLRTAFGWFLVAMSALVLLQQAPAAARDWLLHSAPGIGLLTAFGIAVATGAAWRLRAARDADLPVSTDRRPGTRPARRARRGGLQHPGEVLEVSGMPDKHEQAEQARDDVPSTIARSDDKAVRTYKKTLDSAEDSYDDTGRAHRAAYASLKHTHEKVGDHWEPKEHKGPSDAQAERGGADARDHPVGTASGVDANASKDHLVEVAHRVGVAHPERLKKADLVHEIEKANARTSAKARQRD